MKTRIRPLRSSCSAKARPALFVTTSMAALLLAAPAEARNITLNNMSVGTQTNSLGMSITTILISNNSTVTGSVINAGTISQSSAIEAIGIGVDTSTITAGISNSGSISLTSSSGTIGPAIGIFVTGNTLGGGIANMGTITAVVSSGGGAAATGISVAGNITGGINNSGAISATGPNRAVGINALTGTLTGGINNVAAGAITATSTNGAATGIAVAGASLTGATAAITNNGTVTAKATTGKAIGVAVTTGTVVNGAPGAAGISNTGTISATGKTGIGIQLLANSAINGGITNSGTITGSSAAIDLSQATVATTINQQGGALNGNVNLSPNGDSFNFTGGVLNGTLADVSGKNTGTVTVSGGGAATLSTTAKIMGVASFTHAAGSTLAFQATPTLAPSISAGTITLNGIFTVAPQGFAVGQSKTFTDVFFATSTLSRGASFTIANPMGFTVTLSPDAANANALDLQVTDNTANAPNMPNTPVISPSPPIPFASLATTANQRAAAGALQALGSGALFDAVAGQSAANAPQAFDALSGEVHASVVTAIYNDAFLPQGAVLARLNDPVAPPALGGAAQTEGAYAAEQSPRKGPVLAPVSMQMYQPRLFDLWGQGFGDWGRTKSDGNAATLSRSTGGFVLGGDVSTTNLMGGDWRFGLAGGYTNDSINVSQRGSSGTFESVFGGAYAGASFGAIKLRGGALYGTNTTSVTRSVTFLGFFDQLSSNNGGSTAQAFGEAGYRIELAGLGFGGSVFPRASLEPFAGAAAILVHQNGFTEAGGTAALTGFARDFNIQTTTLGVRGELAFGSLPLTARVMLGLRHAYGDVVPSVLLSFQGGSQAFGISGVPIDRDAFVAEAGIDYSFTSVLSLGVAYSGQFGQRATDNAFKGNVNLRF